MSITTIREKGRAEFPTKIQAEMLRQMLGWDSEYYYSYNWFDNLPDKKILKKEMRGLISRGYVRFCRGGINDDGEVTGGSGFIIDYDKRNDVKELLKIIPPQGRE